MYDLFILANGALSVTLSTNSVLQKAGSTVWVDCTANPKDSTSIKWDKDGEIPFLPASGKPPGDTFVMMNNTLKIVDLKRRQAGTYRCIASSGEEQVLEQVIIALSCKLWYSCILPLFLNCILMLIVKILELY